ncbi:M23 family metallopeptidase [Aquimonas sp.]|jgi:murein DD-endopeptidase MepM/ murein hydrolase activator NlpD|uniref:M23 family metallopeptidase n=1 Tax=Aquimonas sp. TaxID=1872588 RepID=UPI0037C0F23F
MNVIIVASFLKAPRKLNLRDPRLIGGSLAALALLVGSGVGLGWALRSSESVAMHQLESLDAELAAQRETLTEARLEAEEELNAMAARLGQLQAHANRLNALGERLTQVGRLEDGEFDFSEPPALGGPEDMSAVSNRSKQELVDSLEQLAAQMAAQGDQLAVLESLLLDRELEQSMLPTGSPVRSGYASSTYGNRIDPFTGRTHFHSGVDFNGPRGTDILSVADGVVAFSGRHPGYGNMVDIDHGNGYVTRYAHNQENLVQEGDRVRAGSLIAKMGSTGRATGSHVHIEVIHNGRTVNPHPFLREARQRG